MPAPALSTHTSSIRRTLRWLRPPRPLTWHRSQHRLMLATLRPRWQCESLRLERRARCRPRSRARTRLRGCPAKRRRQESRRLRHRSPCTTSQPVYRAARPRRLLVRIAAVCQPQVYNWRPAFRWSSGSSTTCQRQRHSLEPTRPRSASSDSSGGALLICAGASSKESSLAMVIAYWVVVALVLVGLAVATVIRQRA